MRILLTIVLSLLLWSCARQTQPGGGPKDVDPPELISSTPKNQEKNFRGTSIELTFDEAIKLKDAKEEILISPSPGSNTKFLAKKNKVIITPERKWSDSTTYSISFRDGIQDLNESNIPDDLHLAFSTGSTIDSLQIFGFVREAFQDKIPEKITVAIYQSDTFDIFKHKPVYFTKTNKKGRFSIRNLKPGKYWIYAFDDKSKNLKVDSRTERFGFLTKEIVLPDKKDSIAIQLIHSDSRQIKVTTVRNSSTISTIRFNKPIDSVKLKAPKANLTYTFGDTQAELVLLKNFDKADSVLVSIFAHDSTDQKLDTAVYIKYTDTKSISEKFKVGDWKLTVDKVTAKFTAENRINKLTQSINKDSIYIQLDTTNYQNIQASEISFDTLFKRVKIETFLNINTREKTPSPVILFGKGAITSIDNDSSAAKEYRIKIPKAEETGTVAIEIETKETSFEVQLLTPDNKLVSSFRNQRKYTFTDIAPGDYRLSVFIDSNNNRKWDPGNFYKRIEPEKTIMYKSLENKYTFPIRANWEVGPLLITF